MSRPGGRATPTNLTDRTQEFAIGAYRQLLRIDKKFPNVQTGPVGRPDLPPHPQINRSPPHDRVRGPGGYALV